MDSAEIDVKPFKGNEKVGKFCLLVIFCDKNFDKKLKLIFKLFKLQNAIRIKEKVENKSFYTRVK